MAEWKCEKCGWEGPKPKYPSHCSGCRRAYNKAYNQQYYAKKKAGKPTKQDFPATRVCEMCGETVMRGRKCPTCTREKWARWRAENDWKPKQPTDEDRRRWNDARNARFKEARRQALYFLSGDPPACACCGEATIEFLAIDHVNGGGKTHREQFRGDYVRYYQWMIANPDEARAMLRVLCHNCNLAIGFYGYCPHQRP